MTAPPVPALEPVFFSMKSKKVGSAVMVGKNVIQFDLSISEMKAAGLPNLRSRAAKSSQRVKQPRSDVVRSKLRGRRGVCPSWRSG